MMDIAFSREAFGFFKNKIFVGDVRPSRAIWETPGEKEMEIV
jgi:hypothetical protein